MSDELKPCPFCGGKAALRMYWMEDEYRYRAVECVECGATTPGNYSEVGDQSAWDWNTRADDAPEQPVENGEADSRERLEADAVSILRNAASHTSVNTSIGDMLRYTVPGSGAAPWQLEEDACEALASIIESQFARLTAERDGLQAIVKLQQSQIDASHFAFKTVNEEYGKLDRKHDELKAERDEWKSECSKLTDKIGEITNEASELMKKQPYTFDVHDVPGSLQTVGRYIDELTAERDQLSRDLEAEHALAMQLQDDTDRLRAELRECDEQRIEYRDQRDELQSIIDHMPKTEAECEACQEVHDRLMFNAKVHQDELRDELKHKQLVIDRQRDSFAKMERECAELRKMLADAAEAI